MLKKIYRKLKFIKIKKEYLEELENIDLLFIGPDKLKLKYYKLARIKFIKKLKKERMLEKWEEVCKEKEL